MEFPLECAPGTESRFAPLLDFVTGEDTLCGETGLLALLSKDPALRSSGEAPLFILETLLMSPIGTESPVLLPPAADVSMVMVGARARRGAVSGVPWSAIVVLPKVSLEAAVVGWGRGQLCS